LIYCSAVTNESTGNTFSEARSAGSRQARLTVPEIFGEEAFEVDADNSDQRLMF
jgi:hypothetical protein